MTFSDYHFKDIYLVNTWIRGYAVTKWIHGYVVTEYPHIAYPPILGVAFKWQGILQLSPHMKYRKIPTISPPMYKPLQI